MRFDSPEALTKFISQNRPNWARGITVHHTGIPNLNQRPEGFQTRHIANLKNYYFKGLGWSGCPHFFVDDQENGWISMAPEQPLSRRGVHAVSFNRSHIGIEMLGCYDEDPADLGRGAVVIKNTQALCALICKTMGWDPGKAISFHRDDPKTLKSCPGRKVDKASFIRGVVNGMKAPMRRSSYSVLLPGGEFEHVVDHEGVPTVPVRLFAKELGAVLPIGLTGRLVWIGVRTAKLAWRDEGGAAWVDVHDAAAALGWQAYASGSVISVRAPR